MTEPCYNPQSAIAKPQSVWSRLFASGARPHVMAAYTERDIQGLLNPANLKELQDLAVGHVVFFANLYKGQEQDPPKGHVPIDGQYNYSDPELVAKAQQSVRLVGCNVIGYMNGNAWKRAGLSPFDALAEIERHGCDGVYLDNAEFGRRPEETLDFMVRLKALGLIVIHHTSIEPHFGYVNWRGPWADYEDYTRLCETGPFNPTSVDDPLWRYYVSQVTRSKSIGIFKPREPWKSQPELWCPMQPELGCIRWLSPWYIDSWKEHYWPAYERARAEYQADPAGFEARMMEKWRRPK